MRTSARSRGAEFLWFPQSVRPRMPKMIRSGMLLALAVGLLTVFLGGTYAAEERGSALPPPFTARAFVRTSEFLPGVAQPQFTKEAEVIFNYSNAWWRIDAVPIGPEPGVFESCMTIPGGTRYLVYPMNPLVTATGKKPAASATACPMMLPPPGRGELFKTWLMFCPQPKLPIKDSTQIYRLLPIPECETDLFFHTNNLGDYSIAFDGGTGNFVSDLRIRNRGTEIELLPTASGFEPKFYRLPSPFKNGYLEYEYALLSTTNYLGNAYPARAIVKRMVPTFNRTNSSELYTRVLTEIHLLSLGSFDESSYKNERFPKDLVVSDMRFTNLPGNASITYRTADGSWQSTADPQIANRARQIKKNTSFKTGGTMTRQATKVVLLLFVLAPIAVYLSFKHRKNPQKHHYQNKL